MASVAMKKHILSPSRLLVFGFGAMILLGTFLLSLPFATKSGVPLPFVDALFTSTSAVCVTGLSIFDIGSTLSLFGQVSMLFLVQAGGIGFMAMTSMVYMLIGRRFSLRERIAIQDSMSGMKLQGVVRMTQKLLIMTAVIELIGFMVFATRFVPLYGIGEGLYLSIYQSISCFCNAGFDIFSMGTSIQPFAQDPVIMITTMSLITLGGLGFFVLIDLQQKSMHKKHRLTLHTKIVLIMSLILTVIGFILFLLFEADNEKTFKYASAGDTAMGAMFQSVTARTAGFAGVPQADLMPESKVLTVVLMFIGASPSGTAGGIKTTTVAVLVLFVLSILRGREDVNILGRRINRQLVLRSVAVFTLGITSVLIATAVIAVVEHGVMGLPDVVFEVVSAFGTVGIASGNTSTLSAVSLVVLVVTMYGGRVGIFTFTTAIASRMAARKPAIRYPEDKIMIG